jgi:hypothetical protein
MLAYSNQNPHQLKKQFNMKQTFLTLIVATIFSSCGSSTQNQTQDDAKQLAAGIQKIDPDGIPTTEGGWTMTAKINGREWTASSIMPLEATGRIIGDYNGAGFGFPYDKREMVVGKKEIFGQHNVVQISTINDGAKEYWDGVKGEMEITKVEADWVEGKFFVTGNRITDSSRQVEITDGFFRISIAEKK